MPKEVEEQENLRQVFILQVFTFLKLCCKSVLKTIHSYLFWNPSEIVHLCFQRWYDTRPDVAHWHQCWQLKHSIQSFRRLRILGAGRQTLSSGTQAGSRPEKPRLQSQWLRSRGVEVTHGPWPSPLSQNWAGCPGSEVAPGVGHRKTRPGRSNRCRQTEANTSLLS